MSMNISKPNQLFDHDMADHSKIRKSSLFARLKNNLAGHLVHSFSHRIVFFNGILNSDLRRFVLRLKKTDRIEVATMGNI